MNQIVREKNYLVKDPQIGARGYQNLSQSYLRSETDLSTNASIKFVLQQTKKQSTAKPTERLLGQSDKFVITHMFVGLKQIATDAPTDAQEGTATVYTWENPTIFSGTNAANVAAVYNGSMNFKISRVDYIPALPVRAFRRVPETQSGSNLDYTASGISSYDSFTNSYYGFLEMDPTVINGTQDLDLSIDLGGTSYNFDDATNTVTAVCELRGYLITNSN